MGPPGAGKGTQAKQLARNLDLAHISTGDILRENVARGSDLGKQAKDFMNKGELVPDELVNQMLIERLKEPDTKKGFILDGYPRNLNQAKALDEILKSMMMQIDLVIDLDSSEAVIIQRLSGRLVCRRCLANFHKTNMPSKKDGICDNCGGQLYQRQDDKRETIKNRLLVYRQEVSDLMNYYRQNAKLKRICADEDVEVVLNKIIDLVKNYSDASPDSKRWG